MAHRRVSRLPPRRLYTTHTKLSDPVPILRSTTYGRIVSARPTFRALETEVSGGPARHADVRCVRIVRLFDLFSEAINSTDIHREHYAILLLKFTGACCTVSPTPCVV